ncbi:MAG: RNA-binding S4 domain-containing protein [Fimbriimonas sp.]|nr:RNA-binding S4 domain-containing protein [Fimbriimonas sp.]
MKQPDREQIEQTFAIRGDLITLGQLIKTLGLIGSGAEIKEYLAAEQVFVNGELDCRRGRKIRPGDAVLLSTGVLVRITSRG